MAYAHVSPACPAPVTSFGNQLEHMCVSDGVVYTCIQFVERSEIESNNWHENAREMTYNSFLELFNYFYSRDVHEAK